MGNRITRLSFAGADPACIRNPFRFTAGGQEGGRRARGVWRCRSGGEDVFKMPALDADAECAWATGRRRGDPLSVRAQPNKIDADLPVKPLTPAAEGTWGMRRLLMGGSMLLFLRQTLWRGRISSFRGELCSRGMGGCFPRRESRESARRIDAHAIMRRGIRRAWRDCGGLQWEKNCIGWRCRFWGLKRTG